MTQFNCPVESSDLLANWSISLEFRLIFFTPNPSLPKIL
jgi:hypothetical protein